MKKSPILAFILAFFPGGGLLYLGKVLRGLFYMAGLILIPIFAFILLQYMYGVEQFIVIFLGGAFLLLYLISIIDTAITSYRETISKNEESEGKLIPHSTPESERFFTIILSFVPGLGHFQLGLMNRGVTLLAAFFGLGAMIMFVTALSNRGEFMMFLALLPVLWVYSFFDSMQLLTKKQNGETLVDRSILEEFESRREDGKKSKSLATLLSMFPGAGHLYLGLQRRGIQLMAAFLFSIYILDVLRLGIFLFLVPIIWFYSFFDGLQRASRYGKEPLEDTPVISYLINHQKWVGIGLVALGIYYMFTNILLPVFSPFIQQYIGVDFMYWVQNYLQTGIVCVLLIGGGLKLLGGSRKKDKEVS
ncbi:hypothetical protein [Rossellomorea sp. BNER]|uniref:hypothetical protein n=1 Tax=Rossellomorea sp. BNER TaxID=2962031 RepID=UPI003AF2B9E7|nr:hypothetical protein [Rossellomorea sp. BNER]